MSFVPQATGRNRPMAVLVRRVGLSRKRTFRAVLRRRECAHPCRSVDHRLCSEADVRVKCVNGRDGWFSACPLASLQFGKRSFCLWRGWAVSSRSTFGCLELKADIEFERASATWLAAAPSAREALLFERRGRVIDLRELRRRLGRRALMC